MTVVNGTASTDNESDKNVSASCSGDQVALGGGFRTSNVSNDDEIVILSSYPSGASTWAATGTLRSTGGDTSYSLQAYVICADS